MPKILWTAEQCREMGRKSAIARAEKKAREAAAEAEALKAQPPAEKPPVEPASFKGETLGRVREHIRKVLSAIDDALDASEPDAQQLERLGRTLSTLEEVERRLSDRSLPPTLKADSGKPSSRSASLLGASPVQPAADGERVPQG